jgi:hypothetical protein
MLRDISRQLQNLLHQLTQRLTHLPYRPQFGHNGTMFYHIA